MTPSHAAAGEGVQAGIAQACERRGNGDLRAARDVLDLRRREGVEVDLVAGLDRGEEILVEFDAEIWMVPALHQERRPADRERLLDLLEDDRLREEVALAPVSRTPVEGAKVAIRMADVGVVDVPVDDEGDAVSL